MDTQTLTVAAPDGRELCVDVAGEEGAPLIVAHNGTPNSRKLPPECVADAVGRGARIACYDRPGYGGSSPHPGRTVGDCAADVRAIAGALGAERIGVWGMSGGGPHALACAALLPDLVRAVVSLASPAPYGAEGLDYFSGMGDLNLEDMKLFLEDKEASRAKYASDREEFLAATADQAVEALSSLLSPPDAAWLTDERVSFMLEAFKDGLAPGEEGWWEDGVAEMEDWGCDLAAIEVPVQLWHGRLDLMVPVQHGEWLATRIPGVDAHITDEDGHLTLLDRMPDVHDWLLAHP